MNLRGFLLGLALLLPGAAHAADCDDLVSSMDAISKALAEVEIERAVGLAEWAGGQLECQSRPVNTVVLTGLFQLTGAAALFNGDGVGAEIAFSRAVAVSPTTPVDPMYGDEVASLYGKVQRRLVAEPTGALTVLGPVEAWLDGRSVKIGLPLDLMPGDHLLQWREEGGSVKGRVIQVATMEARQLTLGTVATLDGEKPPRPPRTGGSPLQIPLLAGGGGGVLAGAVLLGLASATQNAFWREEDPAALAGLQARNHALALTGSGLLVLGAGAVGASFLVDAGPGLSFGWRW
ncbi:MAG: hypothetical protein ABIO70_26935 [Pseudomonadota bacterium]